MVTEARAGDIKFRNTNFTVSQPGLNPFPITLFALFILWGFGYQTLWARLTTHVDGIVTSRVYLPRTWWTHGPGTKYLILQVDGTTNEYVAGCTDASLSRAIPVGTKLRKLKWELSYSVNGSRVDDFPRYFYFLILSGAVALLLWSRHQSLKLAAWRNCRDIFPNQA